MLVIRLMALWTYCSIVNHLSHLSEAELRQRVDHFAEEKGLQDVAPLIYKGALVARDPLNFEQLDELDEDEKEAIRNETLHKWRQPRALYLTVIICSVAAAVQYASPIPPCAVDVPGSTDLRIEDGTRRAQTAPTSRSPKPSASAAPMALTPGSSASSTRPPTSPPPW